MSCLPKATICATLALIFSWHFAPSAGAQKTSVNTAKVSQSPIKLYGQVNELLSACANAGVEITSTTLPARIIKVRMGSPAFYGNLQDGDVIIKGTLENNRLSLTVRRGVSLYGINLATQAGDNTPAKPLQSTAAASPDAATALKTGTEDNTKDPAWKKLKKYDIVMLIDQSGSMQDPVDASGTSKWDWCKNQLSTFASQALLNTGRRFTIITFNGEYVLKKNCSPQEVESTFVQNQPNGGTDLATPLDFALKDYLDGVRINPLLVVVLTDGMPARPDFVERTIIEASNRVNSPEAIKIVFFEIGQDPDGQALLRLLDAGLVREGARYDIVDANSFAQLQQVGLKAALYETFNHNFQTSLRVAPGQSLESELEIVRKRLQEARARNAQNPSTR